jgi:hypothetical protein
MWQTPKKQKCFLHLKTAQENQGLDKPKANYIQAPLWSGIIFLAKEVFFTHSTLPRPSGFLSPSSKGSSAPPAWTPRSSS